MKSRKDTLEYLVIGTILLAALKLFLGGASVVIGAKTFTLGQLDAGATGALVGPLLAAFAALRHKSFRDDNKNGIPDDLEKKP